VQVELLLHRRQVDDAEAPHALDIVGSSMPASFIASQVRCSVRPMPVSPDEHVVRLFRQHEAAGARERIEARLREALELHLAVAVGEEREHVKDSQSGVCLVEGAEHARLVGVAGAALAAAPPASSRPSRPKYFCRDRPSPRDAGPPRR
jgi:hypothetical protein